ADVHGRLLHGRAAGRTLRELVGELGVTRSTLLHLESALGWWARKPPNRKKRAPDRREKGAGLPGKTRPDPSLSYPSVHQLVAIATRRGLGLEYRLEGRRGIARRRADGDRLGADLISVVAKEHEPDLDRTPGGRAVPDHLAAHDGAAGALARLQ